MPGPFPGMDPYLEDLRIWESVHHTFIVYAAAALNAVLPQDYIAETRKDRSRILYVNIVRVADESHVVTTLELLSHANKTPGEDHDAYRRKQRAIYESYTHLLEIDLLRAGTHTALVPLERLGEARYDYLTCLHRAQTGPRFELWPVTLSQRLPRIAVPLDDSVPDVTLDLQAILDRTYDEGAFTRMIDYTQGPVPPLTTEEAVWADTFLRKKGLR